MKVTIKQPGKSPKANRSKTITAVVKKVKKAARIVSGFYRLLRGTPLNTCNLRKVDFTGQSFTAPPANAKPMVVILQGQHGVTFSVVPVRNNIAVVDRKRGFDLTQVKNARVMSMPEAISLLRRKGDAHVIKQGKQTHKGYTMGDMKSMYVGFCDPASRAFTTLETRAIRDDRNKQHLFSLVK